MKTPFELEWLGGPTEAHFRRRLGGVEAMPWGTLDPAPYPAPLVDRARLSWTEGAFVEYSTAAAFAALLQALIEAAAPVDLIGMAGSFVAEEMLHVELNCRLAMELGGGAPYLVDFEEILPPVDADLPPLSRASELVVRTCCVGEALSVPLLAGARRVASHPLTKAVLTRLVQDEGPHARLGWLYLEWAADRLDATERQRLAEVALDELRAASPSWRELSSRVDGGVTSEGFSLVDVHALGWLDSEPYAVLARRAVREDVVTPLRRAGIPVSEEEVEALLAP